VLRIDDQESHEKLAPAPKSVAKINQARTAMPLEHTIVFAGQSLDTLLLPIV
jgi:hypothetical protein